MAFPSSKLAVLAGAIGFVLMAPAADAAQSTDPTIQPAATPTKVEVLAVVGPVQPQVLVSMLRQGGLILWMRHSERDGRSGDMTDAQAAAHDCTQQSLLTPAGTEQARAVGAGGRLLKLPVAAVHAARLCRTEATAQLLDVGPVSTDNRLDEATTWTDRGGDAAYQKAVLAILYTPPPNGQNIVEVTSLLTVANLQPAVLAELGVGEVAVFQPHLGGSPELLARVGRDAWPTLLQ